MLLLYFSNERFPSSSACSIQQMFMCEAFAKSGFNVTLVSPSYQRRVGSSDVDLFSFYGTEPIFKIKMLPTLLGFSKPANGTAVKLKRRIPLVGGLSMLVATTLYIFSRFVRGEFRAPVIVYSRNINAAVVFLWLRKLLFRRLQAKMYFEAHSLTQQPKNFFERVLKKADGLVCITSALKDALCEAYGLHGQKIVVCPDGVQDSRLSQQTTNQEEARARLGISGGFKKLIVYTGQLLPGKGVEVLLEAAKHFDDSVLFYIVGGTSKQIDAFSHDQAANVRFTGFVQPNKVPLYQQAADVLVLPNTSDSYFSAYTSPLKLFEYMTARRPIVASDQPVIREILRDGENAVLFRSGDPCSLTDALRRVLADENLSAAVTACARKQVEGYSWTRRAQRISEFIDSNYSAI
jgi:glycosyltransferase involved in cell wall biosynthesis